MPSATRATRAETTACAAFRPTDTLRTPRERLWYVGDNARGDAGGALAAGLRAVWFNWENQSYPQDLPPPTRTVEALGELEALVENTIAP